MYSQLDKLRHGPMIHQLLFQFALGTFDPECILYVLHGSHVLEIIADFARVTKFIRVQGLPLSWPHRESFQGIYQITDMMVHDRWVYKQTHGSGWIWYMPGSQLWHMNRGHQKVGTKRRFAFFSTEPPHVSPVGAKDCKVYHDKEYSSAPEFSITEASPLAWQAAMDSAQTLVDVALSGAKYVEVVGLPASYQNPHFEGVYVRSSDWIVVGHPVYEKLDGMGYMWWQSVDGGKWYLNRSPTKVGSTMAHVKFATSPTEALPENARHHGICEVWQNKVWVKSPETVIRPASRTAIEAAQEERQRIVQSALSGADKIQLSNLPGAYETSYGGVYIRNDDWIVNEHPVYVHTDGNKWLWWAAYAGGSFFWHKESKWIGGTQAVLIAKATVGQLQLPEHIQDCTVEHYTNGGWQKTGARVEAYCSVPAE